MPAFVVLTPEEAEIVRAGSLDEPGYRPHPASLRAHLEREEEMLAADEEREPEPVEVVRPILLERTLSAHHWTRHGVHLALLLAPTAPTGIDLEIIAISRAAGGPRSVAPGTRRVTLGPWDKLTPAIPLAVVLARLTSRQRADLSRLVQSVARPLPPALSALVTEVLTQSVSTYADRARELTRPVLPSQATRVELEQRDANATALSILTPRWRGLRPEANPVPSQFALQVDAAIQAATENDLITDDAAVFPGWERGGRPHAGWWEFRHGNRRMWIKNINVSQAETATGADLVYVRTSPEAVVLVQYKRLTRSARGEPYMSHDPRLQGQLNRMLSYQSDPGVPGLLSDHRLGPGFAFVKFVDSRAQSMLSDDELTRGHYLPAEYVVDLLAGEPQGPKGGRSIYVDRERPLDSSIFVRLVREGWIGSRGDVTAILAATVRAPSATLTLAVDQPSGVS